MHLSDPWPDISVDVLDFTAYNRVCGVCPDHWAYGPHLIDSSGAVPVRRT